MTESNKSDRVDCYGRFENTAEPSRSISRFIPYALELKLQENGVLFGAIHYKSKITTNDCEFTQQLAPNAIKICHALQEWKCAKHGQYLPKYLISNSHNVATY